MANEEVLGPRKTMFVLVIVVGCFAVLWPRILYPLFVGGAKDQLRPNQHDRDAGCCDVMFAPDMAVLEVLGVVCDGSGSECVQELNATCGLDIAAFLRRSDHLGKSTRSLLEALRSYNGSACLRDHFGVSWAAHSHLSHGPRPLEMDTLKQERTVPGAGFHPALRERGRAIPLNAPAPPVRAPPPVAPTRHAPAHIRVRPSPLAGYYEENFEAPPVPGMRPPLGAGAGPAPTPKSSMSLVMPIYTICIIVFFLYTLSKLVFKRDSPSAYEAVQPDPEFRQRVFRDSSRSSPDTKLVVTAISGLVAEVQQQMEASYAQSQRTQDAQQDLPRPYTNGTILSDTTPVRIIATEYKEPPREATPEPTAAKEETPEPKEDSPEPRETSLEPKEATPELKEDSPEPKEATPELKEDSPKPKELTPEVEEPTPESKEVSPEPEETSPEPEKALPKLEEQTPTPKEPKQSTPELLAEALKEESPQKEEKSEEEYSEEEEEVEYEEEEEEEVEPEKSSVKHEAAEVASIYLQGDIPQQSRVLVADCADRTDRAAPRLHSPLVVSGKMTLSLIPDAPRDTPERDAESTVDDFTTASALTQPAQAEDDELSEDEVEEEIEVEEIEEEEVEEEEEEVKQKKQ